jgi:hypothetical protein
MPVTPCCPAIIAVLVGHVRRQTVALQISPTVIGRRVEVKRSARR